MASNNAERLAAALEEETRLEAELFGKAKQEEIVLDDKDVISPEEPLELNIDLTEDLFKIKTVPEDTSMKPGDELATLRKELADEKHRFGRYKGSTDRSLFEARSEIATLSKLVATLKEQMSSLQMTKPSEDQDVFTQDVIDVLGEEAVNAIKASNSKAAEQLAEIKKQLGEKEISDANLKAESNLAENQRVFMSRLQGLVPDLDEMNKDDKFNAWLRETGSNGIERLTTLRQDQSRFDFHRVAEFFIKYKEQKKAAPKSKVVTDTLDSHTGPTGRRTAESNQLKDEQAKGTILQSAINEFNRDVAKGLYKTDGVKAEAMEAKIFKAYNEDKIIFDEHPTF